MTEEEIKKSSYRYPADILTVLHVKKDHYLMYKDTKILSD
jgi:hypothetical protein